MKKIIVLVLAMLMICAVAFADNMVCHITAVCYDTNHVGTQWQGYYAIGGMQVYDGAVVDLDMNTYEFYSEIGDYDTTPDIGFATDQFNVTANRLDKGFTVTQTVVVNENSGFYKDYWCEWYVQYDFIPVGFGLVLQ